MKCFLKSVSVNGVIKKEGDRTMSKKKKCPVCPEEWELEYDEYLEKWVCGACGNFFPKEIEQ